MKHLGERLNGIRRVDFFHAPAGEAAGDAVAALEQRLADRMPRRKESTLRIFGFVDRLADAEVPFDMYAGDFSHHGERCTFEVLAQRFGVTDGTAGRLAQIVHDIDMKENGTARPTRQR